MIAVRTLRIIAIMQKHIGRVVVFAAAIIASVPAEAQEAAARAATVLAAARAALGGEETLGAVKTLRATGDFRRALGEMQTEGELEVQLEAPDKLRRDEEMRAPGGATMTRTEVINGNDVWDDSGQRGGMGHGVTMVMRGPGGANLDPEQVKEMQRRIRGAELQRFAAAWLLSTAGTAAHAGIAEAPDGKADVIEITPPDGAPMRLFIDQETHLPLMITWQGPQPRMMVRRGGGPPDRERMAREAAEAGPPPQVTFEMRLSDYRVVNGVKLPHLITRAVNSQANEEWTITSYQVNPSFKPNTFTK